MEELSAEYVAHWNAILRGGRNNAPAYVFDLFYGWGHLVMSEDEAVYLFAEAWNAAEYPARYVDPECWVDMIEGVGGWLTGPERPVWRPTRRRRAIYRGERLDDDGPRMSWTLDRAQAVWFAERWVSMGHSAVVRRAVVRPCDMLGVILDRGESEVIAEPWTLTGEVVRRFSPQA